MQNYHSNATTNINIRTEIQINISNSNQELASRFNTSWQTISKWRNRNFTNDVSCVPKNISYGLSDIEQALAVSIRRASWLPIDEIWEMLLAENEKVKRTSVYTCFVRNGINKVPKEEKEKAKKFKAYEPGYLHIDVTYLPKINGQKYYLYVCIDRATRTLFYKIYEDKSAQSTASFFDKCVAFFPFEITHILTDNGLEFTNRLIKSKKGNLCTKPSLLDQKCSEKSIKHRLTKPSTPQTNGMVERVNGTIKSNTILRSTYQNIEQMEQDVGAFLVYYNVQRRHGGLRKELNVKTPVLAIEKWYELKPEIFKETPNDFKNKILTLNKK